jgi:transcriptional regulator with XRE-family HTH domain
MTTTPERRPATLTELVAQEIDSIRGRKRMSQAQLARAIGKPPMWVSLRLRGMQPIDMNELLMFANALDVGVHDLLPAPAAVAAAAAGDPKRRLPQTDRSAALSGTNTTRARTTHPPSQRTSSAQRRPVSVRSPGHTMPASRVA